MMAALRRECSWLRLAEEIALGHFAVETLGRYFAVAFFFLDADCAPLCTVSAYER